MKLWWNCSLKIFSSFSSANIHKKSGKKLQSDSSDAILCLRFLYVNTKSVTLSIIYDTRSCHTYTFTKPTQTHTNTKTFHHTHIILYLVAHQKFSKRSVYLSHSKSQEATVCSAHFFTIFWLINTKVCSFYKQAKISKRISNLKHKNIT